MNGCGRNEDARRPLLLHSQQMPKPHGRSRRPTSSSRLDIHVGGIRTRRRHRSRRRGRAARVGTRSIRPRTTRAVYDGSSDLSAFDLIVTLCAQEESCPWLPPALSRRVLHIPFEDPSRLGADTPQSVRNEAFRHLMIELGAFCLTLPETLEKIHAAEDMRRS